jgi:hypothetical protein
LISKRIQFKHNNNNNNNNNNESQSCNKTPNENESEAEMNDVEESTVEYDFDDGGMIEFKSIDSLSSTYDEEEAFESIFLFFFASK